MTELPKKIIVNRIPYSVCNSNDPYSYEADPGVQEIRVTQEAAPARKRQYFMWEVAHLLLVSAGMPQKEADRYHAGVGSVLNRLVIDNDTDFVKGRKPVPSMIFHTQSSKVFLKNYKTKTWAGVLHMTPYTYRSWKTLSRILKAMWSSMRLPTRYYLKQTPETMPARKHL